MNSTPSELNSGGTMSATQVLASLNSRATMMNWGMTPTAKGKVMVPRMMAITTERPAKRYRASAQPAMEVRNTERTV
ncbi:hypothetical protein D3C80_2075470 [compost metagenome]